jgi:nitrogen fixation NifU-like protein
VRRFEYSEIVLDHFENPRNVGEVTATAATAVVESRDCGDRMKLSLRVSEDGIITEARFRAFGCVAAIAASSMTTELLRGRDLDSAAALTDRQVAEALGGLPPSKVHCSVMAREAIREAIKNYRAPAGEQAPGGVAVGRTHDD